METLILTQAYIPHRIVGWQKAVTMWVTGKVEVVETYDEVIRSVSLRLQAPAVVRLVRSFRHYDPKVRFSRANVLARDGFRCQYCGEKARPARRSAPLARADSTSAALCSSLESRDLTFDHVVPRSQGGRTSWTNIVTACRPCNAKKGNRTPAEAGLKLLSIPVRPKALSLGLFRQREGVPAPWKTWVA